MKVEHDVEKRRFFIPVEGEEPAVLEYAREGDVLDFYHTFVPPSQRGKGLAAKLVMAGFNYAQKENCRVLPSCPFIGKEFLPRFPQYKELTLEL